MDSIKDNNVRNIFESAYKVYHFVAKVLLYSILIILMLVAIGFAAYFIDLGRNIKNGVTKTPLLNAYIIISPSMVPTINVEDAIVVMRKNPEELKKGDIITFLSNDPRYSGLTITHKIVGIEKSESGDIFFRTKGDNNNVEDAALVPSDNVYGKVILKIPKIGYIQYFLTQSYGWIILVVIPCVTIVIIDIIKLIRSIKRTVKKKTTFKKVDEYIEVIESKDDIVQNKDAEKLENNKQGKEKSASIKDLKNNNSQYNDKNQHKVSIDHIDIDNSNEDNIEVI